MIRDVTEEVRDEELKMKRRDGHLNTSVVMDHDDGDT